jgi:hypothetical protein
MSNTTTIDQAAEAFKISIEEFVAKYKEKHKLFPELYPLELPADNNGLWGEFIMDYHCTGNV